MDEPSSRLSSLLSFLEEQTYKCRKVIPEVPAISRDTLQAYSEAKTKIMSLRVELAESHRIIENLKDTIEKTKQLAAEKEAEMLDEKRNDLIKLEQLFCRQRDDNLR